MSARDELARVIYEHGPTFLQGGNPTWEAAAEMGLQRHAFGQADAVLSKWLPTLTDDDDLLRDVAKRRWNVGDPQPMWEWLELAAAFRAQLISDAADHLKALAAALTPPP